MSGIGNMLLTLALALAAGALIGVERERREGSSAGLRTHMLVCAGSALFTLVSVHLGPGIDVSRIAAQIVTGIGFLGAGTIFRAGGSIRGLTTAAGIWVVAGIGMGIAAGGDLALVACITALAVFGVNRWVRQWEDRWLRQKRELLLTVSSRYAPSELFAGLEERGVRLESLEWLQEAAGGETQLRLRVHLPDRVDRAPLDAWLAQVEGVRRAQWQ